MKNHDFLIQILIELSGQILIEVTLSPGKSPQDSGSWLDPKAGISMEARRT
jgi:hypothetical protein